MPVVELAFGRVGSRVGKRRAVGSGALLQKLQASHPVFKPPLGERAVSGVVAKGGKIERVSRRPLSMTSAWTCLWGAWSS